MTRPGSGWSRASTSSSPSRSGRWATTGTSCCAGAALPSSRSRTMPPKIGTDLGLTPSQTVGPYFSMRLPWPEGPYVVPEGTPGAVTVYGRLLDGAGDPIPDGLIETWQASPAGRFAHPADPRGPVPGGDHDFRGFGRSATGHDGTYQIITLKPGPLPAGDGSTEA